MISAFIELVNSNACSGMRVCEVGVWQGESSLNWLPIVKELGGKGYLVDWFLGNPSAVGPHAYDPESKAFDVLTSKLIELNLQDTAIILNGESHLMADQIPDDSLDLVFIDANHAYSYVSRDIEVYSRKVKPGGIIAGHDLDDWNDKIYSPEEYEVDTTDGHHVGVIRAVQEIFGKDKVTLAGDTVWWTRKLNLNDKELKHVK